MGSTRVGTQGRFTLGLHDRPAVLTGSRVPYVLGAALAAVAAVASGVSLLVPSVLSGPEVTRGNLRGTALVVLVAGVPLLVGALVRSAQGSARAVVLWAGAAAYLAYQGVLLCFGTPFNRLFPAYVAVLGLGVWTLLVLLLHADVHGLAARTDRRLPARTVAGVAAGFAVLNGLAWLAKILPAVAGDDPASVMDGSGLPTSPVWVQDLAFWIPACVVAASLLWRRRPWGTLLTGGLVVFYVVECLSIAADQWFGVRADGTRPELASMTMVPAFLVLAVLLGGVAAALLVDVDRRPARR